MLEHACTFAGTKMREHAEVNTSSRQRCTQAGRQPGMHMHAGAHAKMAHACTHVLDVHPHTHTPIRTLLRADMLGLHHLSIRWTDVQSRFPFHLVVPISTMRTLIQSGSL